MNAKKMFSLVLLSSMISGLLTTMAFASRKHREIDERIDQIEHKQHNLKAAVRELREVIEQQNSSNNKSTEPVEKPVEKQVEVIDCNNPEIFELFYAGMSKNELKSSTEQLAGLYANAKYVAPEEKAFIAEITVCLEKAMERMALTNEKASDREKIKKEILKHKASVQEKIKKSQQKTG